MTAGFDRLIERADYVLSLGEARERSEVLRYGFAGHGQTASVDKPRFEKELHHGRRAADSVQVFHHVATAGFEVGQEGHAIADPLKILELEGDVDGSGHGEEVQDCVGRATQSHDQDHGVLEGGASHDVAGADVRLHEIAERFTGSPTLVALGLVLGWRRRAIGKAHAHRLDGGGHGVGGCTYLRTHPRPGRNC